MSDEFSAEFEAEAVRLIAERLALGVTPVPVVRALDVRPDQLQAWARQQADENGVGSAMCRGSRPSRRFVGCGARSRCFARSKPSQQKWRCTS